MIDPVIFVEIIAGRSGNGVIQPVVVGNIAVDEQVADVVELREKDFELRLRVFGPDGVANAAACFGIVIEIVEGAQKIHEIVPQLFVIREIIHVFLFARGAPYEFGKNVVPQIIGGVFRKHDHFFRHAELLDERIPFFEDLRHRGACDRPVQGARRRFSRHIGRRQKKIEIRDLFDDRLRVAGIEFFPIFFAIAFVFFACGQIVLIFLVGYAVRREHAVVFFVRLPLREILRVLLLVFPIRVVCGLPYIIFAQICLIRGRIRGVLLFGMQIRFVFRKRVGIRLLRLFIARLFFGKLLRRGCRGMVRLVENFVHGFPIHEEFRLVTRPYVVPVRIRDGRVCPCIAV